MYLLVKKIAVLIIFALSSNVVAEKITIAADYWCPYNCYPNTDSPGYLVELVTKALAKYNIEVEYKLMPWHASVNAAKTGEIHGIVGASKDEAQDLVLPSFPLAQGPTSLYVAHDDRWVLDGLDSLRKKELCLVLGYNPGGLVEQYVYDYYPISPQLFVVEDGLNASMDCLTKLMAHEVSILIENDYVIKNLTHDLTRRKSPTKAGYLGLDNLYIAFSPKQYTSYYYIHLLEEGLGIMKTNGEISKIAKKYGL